MSLPTTLLLVLVELGLLAFGRRRVAPVDPEAARFVVGGNGIALAALALAAVLDGIALVAGFWLEAFDSVAGSVLVAILVGSGLVPPLAHSAALAGTAWGLVRLARRVRDEGRGDRDADGAIA